MSEKMKRVNRGLHNWKMITTVESDEIKLTYKVDEDIVAETEAIDVKPYDSITLTIDHNRSGSNSKKLVTSVYSSIDGEKFDTEPYDNFIVSIGAGKIRTLKIACGVNFLKIRAQNEDSENETVVAYTLFGIRKC